MNFRELKKVETADFYIDLAFRRATKAADKIRGAKKKKSRIEKSKEIELAKLLAIKGVLNDKLNEITSSFPSLNNAPEFYEELIKLTLDQRYLKKCLAAVNWARKKVLEFYSRYVQKIRSTKELETINKHRREYYGRVSSAVKQIKENLIFLDQARKTMLQYPTIKTEIKTIAIAGFPNVGKTTLLAKLTGSKAEIKGYAFTTKGINIGYLTKNEEKVQYIDTPGTLNRFDKMNTIEKIAYLALKYVADEIIYVFDLTEPYPLNEQIKLYRRLKEFKIPIEIYFSKQDLLDKKQIEAFKKEHGL